MKQLILISIATIAFLGGSAMAGPPDYKQAAPPPPPPTYGVGIYGAIELGPNVYQHRGGNGTCAQSAGTQLTNPNTGTVTVNTGGGRNHADLAWQIIAGSDYYWTPKFSTFIEYKFLEYTSTQIDTNHSRVLGQQLIGAGVRFHF